MNEPPLSPGPAPAPAAEPAPASPSTSLEAQVVRLGLMTTAEVAQTMQEEAETGRSFAELAVESGRIAADDLARLTNAEAAPAAPEPRVPELQLAPVPAAPEQVESPPPAAIVPTPVAPPQPPVEPEPEVEAVPEPVETAETEPVMKITLEPSAATPAPSQATSAGVFVRLTSGERISAGRFETPEAAERRARELMIAVDAHGDWPCVDGRFIKPDAVVSIDVDTAV